VNLRAALLLLARGQHLILTALLRWEPARSLPHPGAHRGEEALRLQLPAEPVLEGIRGEGDRVAVDDGLDGQRPGRRRSGSGCGKPSPSLDAKSRRECKTACRHEQAGIGRPIILPYDAVRTAGSPDDVLLAFLQSTYEAAADLARWDRAALERPVPSPTARRP